jgi:hypothetical protein
MGKGSRPPPDGTGLLLLGGILSPETSIPIGLPRITAAQCAGTLVAWPGVSTHELSAGVDRLCAGYRRHDFAMTAAAKGHVFAWIASRVGMHYAGNPCCLCLLEKMHSSFLCLVDEDSIASRTQRPRFSPNRPWLVVRPRLRNRYRLVLVCRSCKPQERDEGKKD